MMLKKLNGLDAVSGATASSNAIKEAAMNALGVTIEKKLSLMHLRKP